MRTLLQTQEIGSLKKPEWLLRTLRDARVTKEAKEAARDDLAMLNIKTLEDIGLDYVYDGEARRVEMYEYPVRNVEGFAFTGRVRSFDNRYYRKARCVRPVRLLRNYHLDEFLFVKEHAKRTPKIPVTGPYTLVDWSFNEHYDTRRDFLIEVSRKIINPLLKDLDKVGAKVIQLDEPAATTHPDEMEDFKDAFNEAVEGVKARISVHVCYSGDNYRTLFPILPELAASEYALEFANRDSWELGTSHDVRKGYSALKQYEEYAIKGVLGLGVVDVHTDSMETAELVRDRILYAARAIGDPTKLRINPDCGLRTRSRRVAFDKLRAMVQGTNLARKALR